MKLVSAILVIPCFLAFACNSDSTVDSAGAGGITSSGGTTSSSGGDTETGGSSDTGGASGTGGASDTGGILDAGVVSDAGGTAETGGTSDTGGTDEPESTACCAAHSTPGCDDKAVEECVCEYGPDCCSGSWSELCVEFVRQRFCDPGVRECVCNAEDDPEPGWGQNAVCCEGPNAKWTDTFCEEIAASKCGATVGCRE